MKLLTNCNILIFTFVQLYSNIAYYIAMSVSVTNSVGCVGDSS